jgi:hypothetical protein
MPVAILVGLCVLFLRSIREIFRGEVENAEQPRHCFAVLAFAGMSIFLFGVGAFTFQTVYRVAMNPRAMGRIERTWTIVRGNHNQHVRVADVTFTVSRGRQSIDCEADNLDIGDGAYFANVGDSIELSPLPGGCARPYVMNIQPPAWAIGALSAVPAAAGIFFALLAWAASNPRSGFASWLTSRPSGFRAL